MMDLFNNAKSFVQVIISFITNFLLVLMKQPAYILIVVVLLLLTKKGGLKLGKVGEISVGK